MTYGIVVNIELRDIGNHVSTGQYEALHDIRSDEMDDDGIYGIFPADNELEKRHS